ncbi:TetR/AcrR family transcriptional regulator [Nocardia arizonensis]|uniref:TetR/AcrR family transcriptional regulator n=1 Tax=Nocardia arizonensis TaxID=1141647 RepID=UPI0006D2B375|nr:TetR/AcrR family transcriptional regulator [Nocardia arizonensis]
MAGRRGWGGNPPGSDEEASARIVAAAVELIGRTGAAIGIADVAESLGVIRQTVYRYFPSADALMQAAAFASVDGFLDRLARQVSGIRDPAEAMTEGVIFTLTAVRQIPHLGIVLSKTYANDHTEDITSKEAHSFGMAMLDRFDVDWERYGYDESSRHDLVEFVLRTMQSFFISPGNPPRAEDDLRRYLRRWMGSAIAAQAAERSGTEQVDHG